MTTCTRHPHITNLKKLLLLLFGYFGYVHFIFNPSHKLPTEDRRGRFSTAAAARAVLRAVLTVSGSDRIDWQKHLKLFQKLFHIVSATTQPQGTWSLSFQQDFMPASSKEGSPGGPSTGHICTSCRTSATARRRRAFGFSGSCHELKFQHHHIIQNPNQPDLGSD